jgi:RsiW-degrading membrane proteinase PrsW (M82 family)
VNKIVLKFLNLTEKLYLHIYQIAIVLVVFFYALLKGATGHQFIISIEEKMYFLLLFFAFVLSGFYKERKRFGKKNNKVILWMFLVFSIITFVITFCFFFFSITFNYKFWESPIIISLTGFVLPILFIWCNFYLIRNIVKELVK